MEPLYNLVMPRFNMPEFGSVDEDYLCEESKLDRFLSEFEDNMCYEPTRILEQTVTSEDLVEWEYFDSDEETWFFEVGHLEAELVYIRVDDIYRRCVRLHCENVLIDQRKMEEAARGASPWTCRFRRLESINSYNGILRVTETSQKESSDHREELHNKVDSLLFYFENSYDTAAQMRADVKEPAPIDLRRFFQDVIEM